MATVLTGIVQPALREIGVLAAGEAATYADANDALTRLNQFVDRLGTEKRSLWTITRSTKALTASTQQYTIGSGGDFNITWPRWIDRFTFIDTSVSPNAEYPLRRMTEDEYQLVSLKSDTSTYPTAVYYNPTFSSSLATVDYFPIQTSTTLTGVIYHWAALAQFTALTQTLTLPPGYQEMLMTNLAVLLCPQYGVQPHPVLTATAQRTMADIKRANTRPRELLMEFSSGGVTGGYDIHTE